MLLFERRSGLHVLELGLLLLDQLSIAVEDALLPLLLAFYLLNL